MLGEVDGLSGEVWGGGVAFGRSSVAIGAEQALLELYGTDGGVHLQRRLKARVVGTGKRRKKLCRPGPTVATVSRQTLVYYEGAIGGDGYEELLVAEVEDVIIVLDAVETIAVGNLVLTQQNLVGALQWAGDDEAATLVVERWQDDRCGGHLLHRGERRAIGCRSNDTDDTYRLGGGLYGVADGGSGRWVFQMAGCVDGSGVSLGGNGGVQEVRRGSLALRSSDAGDGGGDNVFDGLRSAVVMLEFRLRPGCRSGFGFGTRLWRGLGSSFRLGAFLGWRWFLRPGLAEGVLRPGVRCGVSCGGVFSASFKQSWRERQGCERQDGCDGGVCAHSDLKGAETPEQVLLY